MRRLLAAAAVLALGLATWLWLHNDRRQIERRFDRLLRACEKSAPDSPLSLLERGRILGDSFATGFVVHARPYEGTISEARELAAIVHRYRATARTVRISTGEAEIELAERGTAEMTTVIAVSGDRGAGPGGERFRARFFWVRERGEWRIRELEIVEVLETTGLFF